MLRILLFLGTNIAIIALISVTFRLLGLDGILAQNGVDLDMNALLIYSAVIGFSGSLISLFLSKFMAKKSMGVHLIEQPQNQDEMWLMNTVQRQAQAAGIGMPEVGIFEGAPERVRDRLEQERGPGRCQHRPAADHEPRRGRGRDWRTKSVTSPTVTW